MKKAEIVTRYSFIQPGDVITVDGLHFNVTRTTPHNVYLSGTRWPWCAFHRYIKHHTAVYTRGGQVIPESTSL